MAVSQADDWSTRIGLIFDGHPRVAVDDLSRWIDRKEESKLRSAVVRPGMHVCLYGPSGSGKTSLAKTIMGRLKGHQKFIYVRLSDLSSWQSFKSQLFETKNAKTSAEQPTGIKIGFKNFLPYLELEGSIGGDSVGKAATKAEVISAIDTHHLSQFLVDKRLILVVDDLNFVKDIDLLKRLTNLAREIIDNSEDNPAKVVFVGADDVYIRLLEVNASLRDRIEEVSLGSVREDDERPSLIKSDRVWKFIADGLKILGLQDPRKDPLITSDQLLECVKWINHAADGLPKSIVRIGQMIAEKGEGRSRVSYTDIVDAASQMTRRNFRQFRSRYRSLIHGIREDETLQEVCLWMFKRGASQVHSLDSIAEDLRRLCTYAVIDEALKKLEQMEFIVITGANREVFFTREPLLAHTIGVALAEPDRVGVDKDFFGGEPGITQLLLRFTGEKDPENRKIV